MKKAIPPTCHTYVKIDSDGNGYLAETAMFLNGVEIYRSPNIGGH